MRHITLKSAVTGLFLLGSMGLANAAGGGLSRHEGASQIKSYLALAGSSPLAGRHQTSVRSGQLEEPAISPNGIPTLSDFAERH